MSSAPTPDEIARDARWLAQALNPAGGVVRLVAMDRASYRAASFLDDRLIQLAVDAQIVPWPEVEAAVANELRSDARWIFHIGHVGSTLVSRLLGEIDGVLAVREPRLLRDVALVPSNVRSRYLGPVPKLMSRTFSVDEVACVKATSFTSDIAPELVTASGSALFLYAQPRKYIASILAGENSVKELHAMQSFRDQRLASRGISWDTVRTDAERAAAAWACEMVALECAADAISNGQIAWANFDTLLDVLPDELGRIARHFGFNVSAEGLRTITQSPLIQRYSKDPTFEYSPDLRRRLIDQEMRLQGGEIDQALAVLAAMAERSPLIARALQRAEGN